MDPTLHWANPGGGEDHRDGPGTFDQTPGPYRGPVPLAVHLHGGHSDQESDGYPEAWFLPDSDNIPDGYARVGSRYEEMAAYFEDRHGASWAPGTARAHYGNDQAAGTLWFHDHALGITRLNVYAGQAGFYLLRGGAHDLAPGVLPATAPAAGRSTRSPWRSRTGRSPATVSCSTPTAGRTSTSSPGRTSRTRTSPPSGTRSSSATR